MLYYEYESDTSYDLSLIFFALILSLTNIQGLGITQMIMSQIYRAGALLPFMIPDRFNLKRLFSNGAAATELAGIEDQLWS